MGAQAPTHSPTTMANIHQRAYHWLKATGINPNRGLTRLAHMPESQKRRLVPIVLVDVETGEIIERPI